MKLSRPHQNLLVCLLLAAALQAVLYMLLLRPRLQEAARQERELTQLQQRFSGSPWPRSATLLRALLGEMQERLEGSDGKEGIATQTRTVLEQAGAMFERRIREQYGSREEFIRSVSRLDYQEEYIRLQNRLQGLGITLHPTLFNLAENSAAAYNYQLMLQLWTSDTLCRLIHASGLAVATANVPGGTAAQLAVLPLNAFFENEKAPLPYLLELPLAVTVQGTLGQFRLFLESLQSPDHFLAIRTFELFVPVPDGKHPDPILRVALECSAYFPRQP